MQRCTDPPAKCRRAIADKIGEWTHPDGKEWQYETRCPECGHGGFSIGAPDQTPALRHIWACNCHRCNCDPLDVREALLSLGISRHCLGSYARPASARRTRASDDVVPWPDIDKVLRDPSVRALADFRIRIREARFGPAPQDWQEFLDFAGLAGVPRSKRYEAAARMGRRRLRE